MKNNFAIKLIKGYQKGISSSTPPKCRYYPTCSNYAIGCYEKFNFFKATYYVIRRLLRCNPFHKGGYDPIPKTRYEKFIDITTYNERKRL